MSKTIVWPLGETSSEIQDASSVVNLRDRLVMSGSPFVLPAAFVALSFCAVVWAEAGAVSAEAARQSPVATRRWSCFMDDLQRGQNALTCVPWSEDALVFDRGRRSG